MLKILFSRKLVLLSVLHTNSNALVKNSESPPIRVLVHDHIQVSRHIGYFVITQREVLYKVIFLVLRRGVQGTCLLGVEKSFTDLAKVIMSSGVQGVDFGCTKLRIRKIPNGFAWGRDVGQEERTRIKSFVFAFVFFEIYFPSCKLVYLTLIIFV